MIQSVLFFVFFVCILVGVLGGPPHLLLGPTADLANSTELVEQLLDLVIDTPGRQAWNHVRAHVMDTNGALHARLQVFGFMSPQDQKQFALATQELGLAVSIEMGGALCGIDAGHSAALAALKVITPFLNHGGRFSFVGLESIFSRTHAACKSQTYNKTAAQVAQYAAVISSNVNMTTAKFFLYDALPHYAVGNKFPANSPEYGLELTAVLEVLTREMDKVHVPLQGYWMDCPYEYSRDYPNATNPLPPNTGFHKIAAAVELVKNMGLDVGKTFNSQAGGSESDEGFYQGTRSDFNHTTMIVPASMFDYIMIETWYPHPLQASPESKPYTTTYTALAVMNQVYKLTKI